MSRYRTPQPASSPYITPEGAIQLQEELDQLWKVERPQVTAVVHEAAKNGDRSENGDYIYGKRRLREIDRRVRYLRKRLKECTVVDRMPDDQSRVFFGAWITLEDEQGLENTWRIVGPDEIDPQKYYISIDSPVARKAIGKHLDDEIEINLGENRKCYIITAISYSTPINVDA
ncbi:MAG: transcription elongation factor GreB [Gammaproteobacteria bacterium BRH_c0]|nr:MAG: transcription elongation factor GreB [Gammaproteobacteria bacterium BRH_c0]